MHHPATVLLAPLMIHQGRRLRRTIPKLPEAAGPREFTPDQPVKTRLLVIGDSSAAGVGVDTQEEALTGQIVKHLGPATAWQLQARTGMTTPETITRLEAMASQQQDVVVIALGVNDITAGTSLRVWIDQQRALLAVIRRKFAPRQIVVSGLPPVSMFPALPNPLRWYLGMQAKLFDLCLKQMLEGEADACHLPLDFPGDARMMASDGFHPGAPIYAIWGALAAQVISTASIVTADAS